MTTHVELDREDPDSYAKVLSYFSVGKNPSGGFYVTDGRQALSKLTKREMIELGKAMIEYAAEGSYEVSVKLVLPKVAIVDDVQKIEQSPPAS